MQVLSPKWKSLSSKWQTAFTYPFARVGDTFFAVRLSILKDQQKIAHSIQIGKYTVEHDAPLDFVSLNKEEAQWLIACFKKYQLKAFYSIFPGSRTGRSLEAFIKKVNFVAQLMLKKTVDEKERAFNIPEPILIHVQEGLPLAIKLLELLSDSDADVSTMDLEETILAYKYQGMLHDFREKDGNDMDETAKKRVVAKMKENIDAYAIAIVTVAHKLGLHKEIGTSIAKVGELLNKIDKLDIGETLTAKLVLHFYNEQ